MHRVWTFFNIAVQSFIFVVVVLIKCMVRVEEGGTKCECDDWNKAK